MKISVVIPALDESDWIVEAIRSALEGPLGGGAVGSSTGAGSDAGSEGPPEDGVEVLVVDGGSRDGTRGLAAQAGARVLESDRGRARQLRTGAEQATGDVILFLHADTRLPTGWVGAVRRALGDPACAGGAFGFGFLERGVRERWIERWVACRVAWLGLPYGDQALFLRREVLVGMGGVPDVPIMEDLDLVRAIRRAGRLCVLPLVARTSSRRYAAEGGIRTTLRHAMGLVGWGLGLDRAWLAERMGR
ncbi:MAG: TIGR04283 family arsenosugar biosynthesis glycosyltransferase [Spirochaetaceae bacterium]|nr:TIGR04283 family arsenosugar biosynthesis glycosyltransferase [Spirochaetaceae bacterium]